MIWTQGEQDTSYATNAADYGATLATFIQDIRLTYGVPNLSFIISQLSSLQTSLNIGRLNTVRAGQASVAAADPFADLVVTDGFTVGSDNLHFTSAGQMALGYAFADEMKPLVEPIPEPSTVAFFLGALICFTFRRAGVSCGKGLEKMDR